MEIKARLNYLRIAPRKVRLAANLIKGKSVRESQEILRFTVKKSTGPLLKLLNQAVANAKNNFQIDENNLYISKIMINEGPKLKRWRPRARGQAYEIQKKTSHIIIVLKGDEKVQKEVKKPKKITEKAIVKETEKEKNIKTKKPNLKENIEKAKPKIEKGVVKRIFRRKSF